MAVYTSKSQMGRLAMRVEGSLWVAYYALPNTMEGAVFLGSISMLAVSGPNGFERKQQFMGMMRDFVGDILKERTGVRPDWPEPDGLPAPLHERGGSA